MPSIRKGVRLVKKWAEPMGFAGWRITVQLLPEDQKGKTWGRSEFNVEEEWAVIELLPDGIVPDDALEGLVLHELAHGLLLIGSRSDAHCETVCNRIARMLGPSDMKLCNEWHSAEPAACSWCPDPEEDE